MKVFKQDGMKWLGTLIVLGLLALAWIEVFNLGLNSGHLVGSFSSKWVITLAGFFVAFSFLFAVFALLLWRPERLGKAQLVLVEMRQRIGKLRWGLFALVAFVLAWFFLFSQWAYLFTGFFFRLFVFMLCVAVGAFFLTDEEEALIDWTSFWVTGLILGAVFAFAKQLVNVTDYPFALHWSEGNRLYDYSVMYGRHLYDFPADRKLNAAIDPGRQSLWGLPFLFFNQPGIWFQRLWHVLVSGVPYLLLGLMLVRPKDKRFGMWILFSLWVFLFLNQGPIYAPLVLAGIIVAGIWRMPWWVAVPLIMLASYYAFVSRVSWMFAPALWSGMLAFAGVNLAERDLKLSDWLRGLGYGLAGVVGSFGFGFVILPLLDRYQRMRMAEPLGTGSGSPNVFGGVADGAENFVDMSENVATGQTLLWSRLLPNASFGTGVLLGLLIASIPIILLLIYATRNKVWRLNIWQILAIVGPLAAFLVVGVAASVKVGGGLDLHNLDMFLIGVVFVVGIAWGAGLETHLLENAQRSPFLQSVLTLVILIPAFVPMIDARPLDLPEAAKVTSSVDGIRSYVECAEQYGEVLFMDQRQLLTFGYLDTPLVPEYEKKFVMDMALSADPVYFGDFYKELDDGRFSLIIADPQWVVEKEDSESLAAENNAWVQWVTIPLLERYESVNKYKGVGVELFMPIDRAYSCP